MKNKVLASIVIAPLLTSCALFNPSVGTAKIEQDHLNASGADISLLLKRALQSKSGQLAYWQAGSTVVMAGLIGYGGYKVVTDGGSHQVAVLMAGGGALYGTNTVLYKPTREGMYARAVSSIQCIDGAFSPFNTATGLGLKSAIYTLSPSTWSRLDASFQSAYSLATEYDLKYKQSVLQVATDLNVYLADMQPTPESTYRILTRTIGQQITKPSKDQVSQAITAEGQAFAATVTGDANEKARASTDRAIELSNLVTRLYAWIDSIEEAHRSFNANDVAACSGLSINFGIAGVTEGSVVSLSAGSTATYQIIDTSGKLVAYAVPSDASDASKVTTAITTSNGVFNLQLTATTKTTQPVRVTVKDNGKFGASVSFEVKVP
ncbi:hypothetical protein LOY67_17120 [Pseudomonas sp. B21-056]|uniref:hypothetical protein n=1 Tax=Pseudomonas sp. B21-056 TaxID=2895495 RepID=UPI00222E7018|nr:hypothetical protein [Pseudomonas sp. B21-056]UZE21768.1 hypothetical protein LOY67_17120 [Pseudomonas sp. B21-056]